MEPKNVEIVPEIPANTQLTEACFRHYCKTMAFSPAEIAFVMVDLWNTGFGPKPLSHLGWEAEYNGGKSHCDRAGEIERTRILPMLSACRELGITVVHAPTGDIAVKHRQWEEIATEEERNLPRLIPEPPDWPPSDWVQEWRQEHLHLFRTKEWMGNYRKHVRPNQDIPEPLKPVDGDLVITTGDMMHRLLAERGIRVLFYCGFATNMCLIDKPGAIADMAARGYMPIVIRDASTGTENSETVDGLWITHAFIDQIEMMWGYSITTQEFLSAMRNTEKIEVPCRYLRMHKPMESETGQSRSSGNSM